MTNKKFVIDVPLTIKGAEGNKLTNTTISLVTGADGTAISGLDMDYEDDGSITFAVIAVTDYNIFSWEVFNDGVFTNYNTSVS